MLRTGVEEALGAGPREQVLQLYLSQVEAFFRLPPRSEALARLQVSAKCCEAVTVIICVLGEGGQTGCCSCVKIR